MGNHQIGHRVGEIPPRGIHGKVGEWEHRERLDGSSFGPGEPDACRDCGEYDHHCDQGRNRCPAANPAGGVGGGGRRRGDGCERLGKLRCSREPVRRRLRQCAANHRFNGCGNRPPNGRNVGRLGHEMLVEHALRRRPRERRFTRQHLVEHAPETVNVGPTVEWPAPRGLFRAHVDRRADGHAGRGQLLATRFADPSRDPEIAHHRLPGHQHDVLGFDVAMDDVVAVRIGQRTRYLPSDLGGVVDGELFLAVEPVTQGLSLDIRHDVVEEAVGFPRIVEGQDVGVRESRSDLDLAHEAVGAEHRGELGSQHLDRDGAMMLEIAAEIHRGHPAATELVLDRVTPGQGGSQVGEKVGHARLPAPF